jgi:hypothetical protein
VPPEKQPFINVDELVPKLSVEQVAAYYGAPLPELKRVGTETRTRCFLNCGRSTPSSDRALAIQTEDPSKVWTCHQLGCGKGGNLVSLCDLLKPGESCHGRPRGQRFKEIAKDLAAMAAGVERAVGAATAPAAPYRLPPPMNLPLRQSENERARALVDLDRKFQTELSGMPPRVSEYVRRRPFLSPDVCRQWRMGYLPRDTGEDKSGGTMRGKIVYLVCNDAGEVLTWFGRDPDYEEKRALWDATDRTHPEPEKFHFVKGFQRGLELFGQDRLHAEGVKEKLQGLGLLVTAGPNDVIRLDTLGVPAVALLATQISRIQAEKAAALAREVAEGVVTVFLSCTPEGEQGMKQALGYLAQLTAVRLAWTGKMYGGKFSGRQVESITAVEWEEVSAYLKTGHRGGWTLD